MNELAKIALATTAIYEIAQPEKWIKARLFREDIDNGHRPTKKATKDRTKIKAARKQRSRK